MMIITKSEKDECNRQISTPVLQSLIENWNGNGEEYLHHMRMTQIVRNTMPVLAENLDRLCLSIDRTPIKKTGEDNG
jgi:hypothetical protein